MPILPKHRNDFTNVAEKEIYNKAYSSGYFDTPTKYFFHSLRNHNIKNKVVGEVDFVYLDDQFMIFLESKGGSVRYDSVDDQWWVLGGTKKGDPFAQVTDYLFYIRNKILPKYFPNEFYDRKLIFGYGVMFPDIEKKLSFNKKSKQSRNYKHETIEYDPEIIYSYNDHNSQNGLIKYIEHLKAYWKSHDKYSNKKGQFGIGLKGLDSIRKLFRKDLIFDVPLDRVVERELMNVKQFTEEQFSVLDSFDVIPGKGLIVIGGPGTGKTVLSKELLLRKYDEGNRSAYFCFNKNLAGEVQRYFNSINKGDRIKVFSIHSYLINSLSKYDLLPKKENAVDDYWNSIVPKEFKLWFDALNIEKFDFVVIDEAQDIFTEDLIDSIFKTLNGGIESGNWAAFIDYKYQKFYDGFNEEYYQLFLANYPFNYQSINLNCRNHKNIIEIASGHSGLDIMPCRRTKVPFDTKVSYYDSQDQLMIKLAKLIETKLKEGIKRHQITILTLKREIIEDIIGSLEHDVKIVNEDCHKKENYISISTIHGYKGLENDFIIIAGIDYFNSENEEQMSLIFVGYSRAIMGLDIFIHESCKNNLLMSIFNKGI